MIVFYTICGSFHLSQCSLECDPQYKVQIFLYPEKVAVILLVAYPLTLLAAPARHVREAPSGPTSTTTTPGRWHQPCAGSNPVDPTMISPPQDFTSLPFNPQTHYQEIRDRALQSKDDTHALMQRYVSTFWSSSRRCVLVAIPKTYNGSGDVRWSNTSLLI